MELVSEEDFLRWAPAVGIGFDSHYPEYLRLLPPRDHARFWELPPDPATWPHFTASLLDGLDRWEYGFLWPLPGSWPDSARSLSRNEAVRDVILRGAGIPSGWAGAIRFGRNEEVALIAVLYASLAFGWRGADDRFFVPDHGRQLLWTDHHDVIHVECESEERVQGLVRHMAKAGYDLPRELPDWTFIRPAWMNNAEPPETD